MMEHYPWLLFAHSYLRWVVLGLLLAAAGAAWTGWARRRPWQLRDERLSLALLVVLDAQLVLGLVLYFLASPLVAAALADLGGAMKVSVLRFWAIEHLVGMLVGIGVMHAAHLRGRRWGADPRRHRATLRGVLFALLVILLTVPWPLSFLAYGRPLFRG